MFFNRKRNTTKKNISFVKNNHDLLYELKEKKLFDVKFVPLLNKNTENYE